MVVWDGLFTTAQLDAIERLGDSLTLDKAALAHNDGRYDSVRITRVAWMPRETQTEPLYQQMEEIVLRLNSQYFRYDLFGLLNFQFAVYDGSEQGHFDWHQDYGRDNANPGQAPRKLTISLQLSDGAQYEGCELQVRAGNQIDIAPKKRGTLIAFPAYALHRVTPVTAGVRKSLVIWAEGPDLR